MGLYTKGKRLLQRVKSASLRRMFRHIGAIHRETGRARPALLCDMIWCMLRYGIGYLEYHVFGFAQNTGACRKTFMTMGHNVALARMVNDPSLYPLLNDKPSFLARYQAFVGRSWLDLRQETPQRFADFWREAGTVFAKPLDAFGGVGVEKLVWNPASDGEAVYHRLFDHAQFLVEQEIVQHPALSQLCPASVNTLRIVTLVAGGQAQVAYVLLRMGSGKSHVDNISSGGMYTWVDPDGVLRYPAFCDKTGLYYDAHPVTGISFAGYQLPDFEAAVALCCRAAMEEPRLGYVGWDVAITPHGPVLVEGNNLPGYDMPQNARFHPDGQGLLPRMEALAGCPIPKA